MRNGINQRYSAFPIFTNLLLLHIFLIIVFINIKYISHNFNAAESKSKKRKKGKIKYCKLVKRIMNKKIEFLYRVHKYDSISLN
jgi:hypothetical protein